MDYETTMSKAMDAFKERSIYGDVFDLHDEIASVLTILLGRNFTMYEVAMVHHVTKLIRAKRDRKKPDHYIDGINYLAFAAQFSGAQDIEQDIKDIAAKFAPMPRVEPFGGPSSVTTVPAE
jgi:Domain of unknown function (DUF6378)